MTWISDRVIDQLRDAAAWPELDDRYVITGVAGRGGMDAVYVARDQRLDRDVAVKVLAIADQKGSRAAWLSREAHILARLDHPGIVPVHDTGVLPDGRSFYVMKLVRGRRLDEVLTDCAPQTLRLDLFARVLEAVAFAHANGVVHRDLKPENIMAGSYGEVFVMDWGVAQDGGADAERAVVGTPGFMPPEQAGAREVDARADIFALGAVLSHHRRSAAAGAGGNSGQGPAPGSRGPVSVGRGPGGRCRPVPEPGTGHRLPRVRGRVADSALPAV